VLPARPTERRRVPGVPRVEAAVAAYRKAMNASSVRNQKTLSRSTQPTQGGRRQQERPALAGRGPNAPPPAHAHRLTQCSRACPGNSNGRAQVACGRRRAREEAMETIGDDEQRSIRPHDPVPSGFGRRGAVCFVAALRRGALPSGPTASPNGRLIFPGQAPRLRSPDSRSTIARFGRLPGLFLAAFLLAGGRGPGRPDQR